jgi:hypothetical protein
MLNLQLTNGDAVAVLPFVDASPDLVLEIAIVRIVNNVFVQLTDGRIYASLDGRGLTPTSDGYVVPATHEHREALIVKCVDATSTISSQEGTR